MRECCRRRCLTHPWRRERAQRNAAVAAGPSPRRRARPSTRSPWFLHLRGLSTRRCTSRSSPPNSALRGAGAHARGQVSWWATGWRQRGNASAAECGGLRPSHSQPTVQMKVRWPALLSTTGGLVKAPLVMGTRGLPIAGEEHESADACTQGHGSAENEPHTQRPHSRESPGKPFAHSLPLTSTTSWVFSVDTKTTESPQRALMVRGPTPKSQVWVMVRAAGAC